MGDGADYDASGPPPCVVIGLHHNGLGIVRALGRRGVAVVAVDRYASAAHKATKYAAYVQCKDVAGVGLIDTLCHVGAQLGQPAVLIPTLDRSVTLVSEHRARLEPYYRHSLPSDEVVQRLMSKAGIAAYAAERGFQAPRTFVIGSEDDLLAALPSLDFPCILKPQLKTDEFLAHRSQKAYRIRSRDELLSVYRSLATWEPRVVVQEWIDGPDTSLHFCLYYFGDDGEPLVTFSGRKIRQFIPYCGTACSAEPWPDEIVRDAGIAFFRQATYRGFGAIEFKVDPQGRHHLIEPTVGRTEHLFALAEANGANLVYTGYCHMAGLPLPDVSSVGRPVRYVDWSRDRRAARVYLAAGELTVGSYLRSLRAPRLYPLLAWDDPGPFLAHVRQRIASKPKGAARRLIRLTRSLSHRFRLSGLFRARLRNTPSAFPLSRHRDAAIDWLCAAQDATGTGGVARAYHLRPPKGPGWVAAYPETTGYIIPTILECATRHARQDLRERALRMARWEESIQLPDGGIQGGVIGAGCPPVVFNTGQVVLGWCAAHEAVGDGQFTDAIRRAAQFLVEKQDHDGAWRSFSNAGGELRAHAYDVRVAWALLRAWQVLDVPALKDTALRNLEFTLGLQFPNGWFSLNHLSPQRNTHPLTHTLAYAAEGLLESGLILGDRRFIDAARRTSDAALSRLGPDGFLSGEFYDDWTPAARWCCLTGLAQFAGLWLRFYELTSVSDYLDGGRRALAFLARLQEVDHPDPGVRGGIAGSFPISARYAPHQYVNWAAKFFLDALLLEERIAECLPARGNDQEIAGNVLA